VVDQMKKGRLSDSCVDILPQLRQFSFIMTGNEEVADAALEEALKAALECADAAHGFPCRRSWLFAHLLQALKRSSDRRAAPNLGMSGWVSFLQIPSEERAVLVLTEGLGFDLATAALITGHSGEDLQRLLTTARLRFQQLSPEYPRVQERQHSLQ
jgi:DNA-directed RNA polymerase specialized sigma24 family protein